MVVLLKCCDPDSQHLESGCLGMGAELDTRVGEQQWSVLHLVNES